MVQKYLISAVVAGDKLITSGVGDPETVGKTRSVQLSFVAKPIDNGATYKCVASSAATASPVKQAFKNVSVNCKYERSCQ